MIPVLPTLPHHTLSDWAFGMWCLIDPTQFISPPTSLSFQHGASCHAILAPPLGLNVPYGRLSCAVYCVPHTPDWYPRTTIAFRVDPLDFPPLTSKHYYLILWHSNPWPPGGPQLLLYRCNPPDTLLASWHFVPALSAWNYLRILFLRACTPAAYTTFTITVQYWDGANWTTIGSVSDPTDSWADRGVNSIGFYLQDDQHWVDEAVLMEFT